MVFSQRFLPPACVVAAIFGVLMTSAIVMFTYHSLIQQKTDVHNAQALLIKEQVVRKVDAIDEALHSMRTLFDASSEVDADEFRLLSDNLLSRHKHIVSTSYLPRVAQTDKETFEQNLKDKGFINFEINRGQGDAVTGSNANLFPVLYHEPYTPVALKKLGLDYNASLKAQAVITRAIKTSMTTVMVHAPLRSSGHEYSVVKAIYAGKDTPSAIDERLNSVHGLVELRVNAEEIFGKSLLPGLNMSMTVLSGGEPQELAHVLQPLEHDNTFFIQWHEDEYTFFSGNDEYRLEIRLPISFAFADIALLTGVFLISVMVSFLLILQARGFVERTRLLKRQHEEVQILADEKTKELAREKERAQITLESIEDAVVTTDRNGVIDYMNPIAEAVLGIAEHKAKGQRIEHIISIYSDDEKNLLSNPVLDCLDSVTPVRILETVTLVGQGKKKISAEVTAAPIVGKDEVLLGAVFVSHDVSVARKLANQMEFQATHDSLTGLPNRALLVDRLQQAISRAPWNKKHIAVLFLDLDRFKLVNDTMGHDVGDELLKQVASRLSVCLRDGDTVSRLGGDEFVIILRDLACVDDVALLANKLIEVFKRPFQLPLDEIFTSSSIGISIYPQDGDAPLVLMKKSDAAMYQAKAAGKDKFVFYNEEMTLKSTKTLNIEMELRRALERSEFSLFYQPQVNGETGEVIGVEALIRWHHPELGMVSPLEFIPIAEETGVIIPLGQWVIQTACRHRKAWYAAGNTDVRVSVNISGVQFQHPSLLPVVKRSLDETGIPADLLELELTEGVLARDSDVSVKTLSKLHEMGVHMSIDDFGTGYSSLSYLKRFPLSTLKVDRCFVKDIISDPDDAAICTAIIAMAHQLNLRVIAEGVETEDQLDFLLRYQCNAIQGYYYSPPVPEEKIRVMLLEHKSFSRQKTA